MPAIAKKSSYRLPCVYCNNETTFPSSEKLKEHLLSQHKNNVCRSRQSVEPPPERPSFFSELKIVPMIITEPTFLINIRRNTRHKNVYLK